MTDTSRLRTAPRIRRGNVVVLAVISLTFVIAFMSFAIDYGYIVNSESSLQNAADAGATSGARALKDGRDAAIAAAKRWAGKNKAAGEFVTVSDVQIGQWNEQTATFSLISATSTPIPDFN